MKMEVTVPVLLDSATQSIEMGRVGGKRANQIVVVAGRDGDEGDYKYNYSCCR